MSLSGRTLVVKAEVQSAEDLAIDGRVDGNILCDGGVVTIAQTATIHGDIVARDITAHGRVVGQLVATEVVHIRSSANVSGDVVAARLILEAGAQFNGRVEPQHLDAALRVARYRQKLTAVP